MLLAGLGIMNSSGKALLFMTGPPLFFTVDEEFDSLEIVDCYSGAAAPHFERFYCRPFD